jgi:hypothetical protein
VNACIAWKLRIILLKHFTQKPIRRLDSIAWNLPYLSKVMHRKSFSGKARKPENPLGCKCVLTINGFCGARLNPNIVYLDGKCKKI